MSIRTLCVALGMTVFLPISPSYADEGRKGLAAQTVTGTLNSTESSLTAPRGRKDPYRNLFGVPAGDRLSTPRQAPKLPGVQELPPPESAPTSREPRVVCGMTIIPADPNVDPGIRLMLPEPSVKHHIRIVPPSICR